MEDSNFNFRNSGLCLHIPKEKRAKLFANSRDPDQTPRSAASDLGLHCLPVTLLRVSRLQWVNSLDRFISTARTGAVVDCVVSIGLVLGQQWFVEYQRIGTEAVVDCSVSARLVLGQR